MPFSKPFLLQLESEIHNQQCALLFSFMAQLENAHLSFLQGQEVIAFGEDGAFFILRVEFYKWAWQWGMQLFLQSTRSPSLQNQAIVSPDLEPQVEWRLNQYITLYIQEGA